VVIRNVWEVGGSQIEISLRVRRERGDGRAPNASKIGAVEDSRAGDIDVAGGIERDGGVGEELAVGSSLGTKTSKAAE
jgi:hypothetical protein